MCSANVSLPGNAVHEADFVQINCVIDYKGSWMPVVACKPEVPFRLVSETLRSFDRASYIGMIAAVDIEDWEMIRCETRFVQAETPSSLQVERVLDTPRYHYTWHTLPIRVFNTTGNNRSTGRYIKVSAVTFLANVNSSRGS